MVTILLEPWRVHPLAWIHRAEARAIAAELRAAGEVVRIARTDDRFVREAGTLLVRVSDAVMLQTVQALHAAGLIHERATDRLVFLECDAAPLVGT